jgi:hypothetical protein
MATVYVDMVLVTVMALAMLLGPPRIGIFLAELSRFVGPTLRRPPLLIFVFSSRELCWVGTDTSEASMI